MFRTRTFALVARQARAFATTPAAREKGPVDAAKDAINKVDRTVSDAAVKGIEKGEQVAGQAKAAAGMGASEAKGEAAEMAGAAKGKANEMAGKVKGKAEEIKGKM